MSDPLARPGARALWQVAVPGVFVLLWSLGFVFAKLGVRYAEPFTFLLLRFGAVTVLMAVVALVTRAPWPRSWAEVGHIAVVGLFLHAVYLGGTYAAIALGVSAGVASLIVGLQPLLTATLAGSLLGERVGPRQWLGLLLGFVGVILVLWEKLALGEGALAGYGFSLLSLLGITIATLYQKRFCASMDMRSGAVIQYVAATLATGTVAFSFERVEVQWTPELILALAGLVLLLSVGAISLLNWLIRHGAASRVASLFYLVPPLVALESAFLFGERLGPPALLGMAIAVAGVALAIRPSAAQPLAE